MKKYKCIVLLWTHWAWHSHSPHPGSSPRQALAGSLHSSSLCWAPPAGSCKSPGEERLGQAQKSGFGISHTFHEENTYENTVS